MQNQNSRSRYGIEIQTFLRSPPLCRLPKCHQMPRSGRHLPPQHIDVAILGADLIKGIVWAIPPGLGLPRPCSHVCRVENEQASRLPSVRNSKLLRAPFPFPCLPEPFCEQSGRPSRPCMRTGARSRWIGGDLGWRVQPYRAAQTPAHTPAIEQLQCGQHPALRLFCRMSKPCRRISTLPHAGQYVLSCGSPGTLPI